MDTYALTMTDEQFARFQPDDLVAITARLDELGYEVGGVSLRLRPTPALVIETNRDPTPDLAGWIPPPSRDDRARAVVVGTVQAITAKPPTTRTAIEKWVLAISYLTLHIGEDE